MRWRILLAVPVLSLSLTHAVGAQPSNLLGGPANHAPQHAVAPLPFQLTTPMPSLPPPASIGGEKPLDRSAGHLIKRPGYDALIHDDGRLIFNDRFLRTHSSLDPAVGARATLTFDLGDIVTRLLADDAVGDPYFSDKLALLDETFAQRIELREQHNDLIMDRALSDLPQYLTAIWQEESFPLKTRRRLLFALWDECAEGGNEYTRKGGKAARKIIDTFIRLNLPANSPDAFTADELDALNLIRNSVVDFAPSVAP